MFKTLRPLMTAWMALGAVLLQGCSLPKPADLTRPPLTVNTPLRVVAADVRAKRILVRDVPGVMSSPSYPVFCDMSLADMAILSNGRLTKEKLAKVQTDLAQLNAAEAAGD